MGKGGKFEPEQQQERDAIWCMGIGRELGRKESVGTLIRNEGVRGEITRGKRGRVEEKTLGGPQQQKAASERSIILEKARGSCMISLRLYTLRSTERNDRGPGLNLKRHGCRKKQG